MHDIIDQIHYDHISMTKVLNLMDQELHKVLDSEGPDPDYELLVDSMRYMVNYSDTVHHPKEDAIFSVLGEKSPEAQELIDEIRHQHQTLATMSEDFYEVLKNATLGEFVSKDSISASGKSYIKSLRHHMNLEEGDLLKRARKVLDQEDMREIDHQYLGMRDPLVSDSLEQEYAALYRYLL